MAIETMVFANYADTAALMTAVKAKIDSYNFFNSTTIDSTNSTITCTLGTVDFLTLKFDNKTISGGTITTATGYSTAIAFSDSAGYFSKLISTSKGILFTGGSGKFMAVGATNGDSVGVIGYTAADDNVFAECSAYGINSTARATNNYCTKSGNITTIFNAPISTGNDFFSDIYLINTCENQTAGKYVLGGKTYYMNGSIALAD